MLTWQHKLTLTQEGNHEKEQISDVEIQHNAELMRSEPETGCIEQMWLGNGSTWVIMTWEQVCVAD